MIITISFWFLVLLKLFFTVEMIYFCPEIIYLIRQYPFSSNSIFNIWSVKFLSVPWVRFSSNVGSLLCLACVILFLSFPFLFPYICLSVPASFLQPSHICIFNVQFLIILLMFEYESLGVCILYFLLHNVNDFSFTFWYFMWHIFL